MESRCTVARLIRRRMHMDVHGECHGRPCIKMVLVYHAATLQDVSRGSWRWCWRPCCAFTFFFFFLFAAWISPSRGVHLREILTASARG